MQRMPIIALAAAAGLAFAPGALAKTKAAAPDQSASADTATEGAAPSVAPTPLTSLKPAQLPANAPVVGANDAPLGYVSKVFVDNAGKVSSILVAPAGEQEGKKVPATQVTVVQDKFILAMDKAAFDALPKSS